MVMLIRARSLALRLLLAGAFVGMVLALSPGLASASRPNIVVIQTDDQPIEQFNGKWRDFAGREQLIMPNTLRLIRSQGVEFRNYVTPFPICAPSRASLLSGNYAHNHGVLRISGDSGGWTGYRNNPIHRENLAVWLQRSGYRTLHFGKFINWYGGLDEPVETEVPPGWDRWVTDATDNSTRNFYGYLQNIDGRAAGPFGTSLYAPWENKDRPGCLFPDPAECLYHTDSMSVQAARAIEKSGSRPFYLQLDYHAPHGDSVPPIGPEPATRHYRSALTTPGPRPPGFDEQDISDKPAFVRELPRLTPSDLRNIRNEHQRSIESLISVDQGVKRVYDALIAAGKLENTYIVFTSDNGFFLGQHRISRGKVLPYEPGLRVPMVIRGPGIEPRSVSDEVVANQDLAPTVLALSRARAGRRVDGRSMVRFWQEPDRISRRPILLSSYLASTPLRPSNYTGEPPIVSGSSGDASVSGTVPAQSYVGIRLGPYKYVEYESGDRELYVLTRDPAELENRAGEAGYRRVAGFLGRELKRLRGCRAAECRTPVTRWPPPPE
jgi:N-acetylglucosamine-6-sulfatase